MSTRMDRQDIQLERERCFLISAITPGKYSPHEDPLSELASLIDTAGGQVVGTLTQRLDAPHKRTYFGKGKFEELADRVVETQADTIVADDDLSPTQLSALEDACRRKVIDRNEVILDIFASRARSHQAQLQVELAQAQYELPRLARKWTHLERLGGGIGTRGPGESQIESDRRILRRKIKLLRAELTEIEQRKAREVSSRHEVFTTCLIGYTNAGKSSLLNLLTQTGTLAEDKLFATLDTLTRRYEFTDGLAFLLSDTVGFIRRLPHHLVASFHATLEEAAQADLLLHVVDASDPLAMEHTRAANDILQELGMHGKNRLYLLNKVDAVTDEAAFAAFKASLDPVCCISALTGEGSQTLLDLIREKALKGSVTATVRFPATDGRRFALVNQLGRVQATTYEDADVVINATFDRADFDRLKALPGQFTVC